MKKIKFKWAAQDANGEVFVYNNRPTTSLLVWQGASSNGDKWLGIHEYHDLLDPSAVDFGDDWKQSLRRIKVKNGKLLLREKKAKVVEVRWGDKISFPGLNGVAFSDYIIDNLSWAGDTKVVNIKVRAVQP